MHEVVKKSNWSPERVSNIKSFINKNKWTGINHPSKLNDWKTCEKNNPTITVISNISSLYLKNKIELWKTSNYFNDSYSWKRRLALPYTKKTTYIIKNNDIKTLIVFIFLEQKINFNFMKKYAKKDFCESVMASGKDNILRFNQYMKSDKIPYIIYTGIKYLIKK